MARVSETNQPACRRNHTPAQARQPRIAMLLRRNGTWREVAFELKPRTFPDSAAISGSLAAPGQEH